MRQPVNSYSVPSALRTSTYTRYMLNAPVVTHDGTLATKTRPYYIEILVLFQKLKKGLINVNTRNSLPKAVTNIL